VYALDPERDRISEFVRQQHDETLGSALNEPDCLPKVGRGPEAVG
jgi:hypothetical protein